MAIKNKTIKLFSNNETGKILERAEVKEEYKWDLTHIYSSEDLWEKDFKWIEGNIAGYEKFIGKLQLSSKTLAECLKFDDEIGIKLERLYLYSMLAKDSDLRVTKYQAMSDRIKNLIYKSIICKLLHSP